MHKPQQFLIGHMVDLNAQLTMEAMLIDNPALIADC